jgi:hypothetical protein
MKTIVTMSAVVLALFASVAGATEPRDERYFAIDPGSVQIQELPAGDRTGAAPPGQIGDPSQTQAPAPPSITPEGVSNWVAALDRIVNLAEKVMTIIARNQPVVNVSVNYANAIPQGITHWTQLQGWNPPSTRRYAFRCNNLLGMEVVNIVYQVHWTHGGNYNGAGRFLTGVTVEPISINTVWGWNVDLTAEVPDSTIANVGTTENPVASMQVQLRWKIHTVLNDLQQRSIFYVQGDGLMTTLGLPDGRAGERRLEAASAAVTGAAFD